MKCSRYAAVWGRGGLWVADEGMRACACGQHLRLQLAGRLHRGCLRCKVSRKQVDNLLVWPVSENYRCQLLVTDTHYLGPIHCCLVCFVCLDWRSFQEQYSPSCCQQQSIYFPFLRQNRWALNACVVLIGVGVRLHSLKTRGLPATSLLECLAPAPDQDSQATGRPLVLFQTYARKASSRQPTSTRNYVDRRNIKPSSKSEPAARAAAAAHRARTSM